MKRYVLFVIALIVTAVYLFPLYWMYITVFKSAAEMFQYPPTFWPQHGESHIWQVFTERGMGKFLWNSFIIACGTTAVTVFVGTGAAYALASAQNRWTGFAIFAVLVLQALPSSLMVTPIFTAFKGLGLLETPRLAVVIAQITKTLPFYIVLCRASFVQIPRELRDAAMVDGASPSRAFFGVILPLDRAAAIRIGLIVEPGSNTSVIERLRRLPGGVLVSAFGLYVGRLTMASTSPVLISMITIEPESAFDFSIAAFSSL